MRQLTPEQRTEEITRLQSPDLWPMYPYLPMKFRREGEPPLHAMVMVDPAKGELQFYREGDMMSLTQTVLHSDNFCVVTAEHLVDNGWVVD